MIFRSYFSVKKTANQIFHDKKLSSEGSFLLEIAIGVSVIGIISGFFMTKQVTMNRMVQMQKTRSNIEIVVTSIASYVANNGRIPRPAGSNGTESESMGICIGAIPYNTLGISELNVVDGRGVPLKYIVEPKLTNCVSIHKNTLESKSTMDTRDEYFCKVISAENQKIIVKNQLPKFINDPVVFVVDTNDCKMDTQDNKIIVIPSANTFWVRRTRLLMQYIKTSPYENDVIVNTSPPVRTDM